MIYEFSNKISSKLIGKKIIKEDDKEVYTYGFEIIISSLLILIGMVILGIIFRCLLKVIVFILFFCSLRVQAGGYHAKSHWKCFIYFLLSCFLAILISHLLLDFDKNLIIIILVLIESCIIIITYAPVDTVNKPLGSSEKVAYKKKSMITVIVQSIIIIAMSIFLNSLESYYMVAAIAVFMESLTVLPIINKKESEVKIC
ncbi:accessory gene regulator ArgB-like protein [Vallitalea guaymasensis]|uniref:Accessory gene regulator B family protein n=1 Tax=Vallitalea guaymasensis TaxID=1185412 RepID=A0A8J8M9X2_9FIRM|nr:accessory gene regulator B family protein [Vallitalea guaymasensis]QUH29039.1 accessory gene regulator B family protein [Vallitalea guaymasensis]